MNAQIRPVAVTVNLQGKTVELQQLGEDALFGRASYGKYAYAVGCERLFGLLDRHGIKATVFVPGRGSRGQSRLCGRHRPPRP